MQNTKASTKPRNSVKALTPRQLEQAQLQMLQAKLEARKLTDPRQLKDRIIWDNLRSLMLHILGDTPDNRLTVQRFEYEFKLAETAENYYDTDQAQYVREEAKSQ